MRKFMSILLSMCLLLTVISGCAQSNPQNGELNNSSAEPTDGTPTNEKISVISTIFAPYDFVRQIVGDKAEVTMLLPPGSESHSYEPTPQDIIKIQNCDVFVYVGGDSDAWVQQIFESMDTSNMKIITLMDCVEVVEEEIVEGMEDSHGHSHDEDHEHEHGDEDHHDDHDDEHHDHEHSDEEHSEHHEHEYDEHVWTSPKNAKIIVQKLSDALCGTDPANAVAYKNNADGYIAQLDELDTKFQAIVDNSARKTIIFGDRFPFRYFADAYGLEYFAAFPGCSTETEASAATVAFLIDKVKAENIPVIFHVELSNQKMANTISEETGAEVLLFHACHNVTRDEMASGVTYIDLMNQNAENLKEALR